MESLRWFSALVPRWRFFDHPGDEARLLYRVMRSGTTAWGPWQEGCTPAPHWGVFTLFHNPQGALHHALANLLDQAVSEIEDAPSPEAFAGSTTYGLLKNWVSRLTEGTHVAHGFQFKIVTGSGGSNEEEILVSAVHH